VPHLYQLRGAAGYRARRQQGTKTGPTGIDRRAPWEIVATWRAALRGYLLPVIKAMLEALPFHDQRLPCRQRLGVHQPPGRRPAGAAASSLKSRPRHSNDHGLAETKNGAVLRKCFGDSHPRSVM